jgi:hypothetical protein
MRHGPLFLAILLSVSPPAPSLAKPVHPVPVKDFTGSIGVGSTSVERGQPTDKTIAMLKYCGFAWLRGGIEGARSTDPTMLATLLKIHRATGVKFSWGLLSGGTDIPKLLATGRTLALADALLAFEGNNEPNNWGVTVDGIKGGRGLSWLPVALVQQRLYAAVKRDPLLSRYPIWSISEAGAEVDDVGLQFLTIPAGAKSSLPAGTRYADAANLHNYPKRIWQKPLPDNLAWDAAGPSPTNRDDGLYQNYGRTWQKHFDGYSQEALNRLPRVVTETGVTLGPNVDERKHAAILLDIYLSNFAQGISHTSVYILRDRTDEGGNQAFGFFAPNYRPRLAAFAMHTFLQILKRPRAPARDGAIDYTIVDQAPTVHDLLLKTPEGHHLLVLWGERGQGEDVSTIAFDAKRTIVQYDPMVGVEPTTVTPSTSVVKLTTSDHPIILEID